MIMVLKVISFYLWSCTRRSLFSSDFRDQRNKEFPSVERLNPSYLNSSQNGKSYHWSLVMQAPQRYKEDKNVTYITCNVLKICNPRIMSVKRGVLKKSLSLIKLVVVHVNKWQRKETGERNVMFVLIRWALISRSRIKQVGVSPFT